MTILQIRICVSLVGPGVTETQGNQLLSVHLQRTSAVSTSPLTHLILSSPLVPWQRGRLVVAIVFEEARRQ